MICSLLKHLNKKMLVRKCVTIVFLSSGETMFTKGIDLALKSNDFGHILA
jgi:hypothetical protein